MQVAAIRKEAHVILEFDKAFLVQCFNVDHVPNAYLTTHESM